MSLPDQEYQEHYSPDGEHLEYLMENPQPTPERLRCECKHYWVDHKDDAQLSCAECKCGSWRPTPQTPPVNSREDTGLRGEECDCICGDCKGRKHFNYKDVKCINYQSPLADRVGGEKVEWLPVGGGKSANTTPPSEQSRVRSSKQSEECKDCDHALSRHTGVAGVGHTACRECRCTYFAKVATINVDVGEDESTPPKAEGVGERDLKLRYLLSELGRVAERGTERAEYASALIETGIEINKLLTSATRAAEERKDGEWRERIRRKFGPTSWHICVPLDRVEQLIRDGQNIFDATPEDVLEDVKQRREEGKGYLTGCDNEDSSGRCAGHPSKRPPTSSR